MNLPDAYHDSDRCLWMIAWHMEGLLLTLVLGEAQGVEALAEGGSSTSLKLTLGNGGHAGMHKEKRVNGLGHDHHEVS